MRINTKSHAFYIEIVSSNLGCNVPLTRSTSVIAERLVLYITYREVYRPELRHIL